MMSPFILLLAQSVTPYGSPVPEILQPSAPMSMEEVRFNDCVELSIKDPVSGIVEASNWRQQGGGYLARHCLGYAYAEQFNWPQATKAFAEAAQEANIAKDPRVSKFWAQAGNAALAGGNFAEALDYLNSALTDAELKGLARGEVHLDRARAHVALNDYAAAKEEFKLVHELAPQDPLGWLLSATLARRMGDLEKAKNDIGVAGKIVTSDPAIALEAGNIAFGGGDMANAKAHWEKAVSLDAKSRSARIALKYLTRLNSDGSE